MNRIQFIRIKITDVTDVTVVAVINKKWNWQDHGRMLEVLWCVVCCV